MPEFFSSSLKRAARQLREPVDGSGLFLIRILFGLFLVYDVGRRLLKPEYFYVSLSPDKFHFTYPFFDFVRPLSPELLSVVFSLVAFAALCIGIGIFYRASSVIFLLGYTYIFLLEQASYNNHYYLIAILGFFFCIVDAHNAFSVDSYRAGTANRMVPLWQIALFRAQIIIVYFFGGIAKLNPDWLRGVPLNNWLQPSYNLPIIGPLVSQPWSALVVSYTGILFDLSIGFLLLSRRTRPFALIPLLAFHITNSFLFNIGIFPWMMIGLTIIFFPGETIRKHLSRFGSSIASSTSQVGSTHRPADPRMVIAVVFILIQIILPLRHFFLYKYPPGWSEQGQKFSWHMKLRDKDGLALFSVSDGSHGELIFVNPLDDLSNRQYQRMNGHPQMIMKYARFLRDKFLRKGMKDPYIRVKTLVAWNGRPFVDLVDPSVNLATVTWPILGDADWILPPPPDTGVGTFFPLPVIDMDTLAKDWGAVSNESLERFAKSAVAFALLNVKDRSAEEEL